MEHIFNTAYGRFTVSETADRRSFDRFSKGIFYQERDVQFLRHFITPESVVVDVGAHIGTMSIPFAHGAKQVHAFEPVAPTRTFLERNIELNNLTNITVYPYALGETEGTEYAHTESSIDAAQYTVSKESKNKSDQEVNVRTLDSLVTYADMMKIDAEGMESSVLEGARALIEKCHPTIFCEINFGQLWAHGASPACLARLFHKAGYTLYVPLSEREMGKVWSLSLITGLFHPAFFLGMSRNNAFDVVAMLPARIPHSMATVSPLRTLLRLCTEKLISRLYRRVLLRK